ncbi:heat shock protein Hsp20 [Chondrocystis sp. NIES-4102]|nr:heat shock protein Hsp20 [Chondrocystis sp. NIES-4102]
MALIRYNPWQEMNSLQRQLNRLFDDALTSNNWDNLGNFSKVPAAELTETEEALHLKLEVPGMEAKDLDVQVMVDRVAIAGERKSETKTEEDGRTHSEFRYGKFSRVIPLPTRIQNTNVTANYKDGILNLTLPKAEEEKNKVVKVNLLQESAQ